MVSQDTSPAKTTLMLNTPADWNKWLFRIKERARTQGVWQYVNPELTQPPSPPTEPTVPTYQDVNPGANSIQALTQDEKQTLQLLFNSYNAEAKVYLKVEKGMNEINDLICSTTSSTNLTHVLQDCDTSYEKLKALRQRLAPSDRARHLDLVQRYSRLTQPPQSQGIESWIQEWEEVYAEAKRINLPHVQGDLPLYDFLEAAKSLEPGFSSINLSALMKGKEVPTLYELIEEFRNTRRVNRASIDNASTHSAFSAFQGMRKSATQPPLCACGESHYYRQCAYLNQAIRPVNWQPNLQVQRTIQDKMSKDPIFAQRVERMRQRVQEGNERAQGSTHEMASVGEF